MKTIFRNLLAVIAGIAAGSIVNMGLIMISGSFIPPPEGADNTTMEGLQASMHLFEPKHFLFPFMAHALGTLAGAMVAVRLAVTGHFIVGLIIGCFFMIGGIYTVIILPSPVWYSVTDLAGAYLPMAWLGWWLAARKRHP